MATLQEKFDRLQRAQDEMEVAYQDLMNPATGESLLEGEIVLDPSGTKYIQVRGGKLVRGKVRPLVFKLPAPAPAPAPMHEPGA